MNNELDWLGTQNQKWAIPVPHGHLESVFCGGARGDDAVVLIAHPHPLHGGTMANKVVTTIAQSCRALELPHLRYNSRGVGQSSGSFDRGIGESEDLLAIVDMLSPYFGSIVLTGFSFGGYVAYRAACQTPHAGLLTVAPAVNHGDFCEFERVPQPWQVLVAGKDEVIPLADTQAWYQTVEPRPIWYCFEESSHFFHGQLIALREKVCHILMAWLPREVATREST